MCGIIGAVSLSGEPLTLSENKVNSLMDLMDYRGPDSRDIWFNPDNKVVLGHLRLSILDPRPSGIQPMHRESVNGNYSISFNGEVFNFIEIRQELEALGYSFSTDTDTEVILNAYMAWGTGCINKFNGMYGIAIYDHALDRLFLVRDRVGIKPVYYNHDKERGILSFASEVKALRPIVEQDTTVDPHLLDQYMRFGYIPGEDTLNKGIKRLLPGHYLIAEKGNVEISKYWDLDYTSDEARSEESYMEELDQILNSSLDLRLRADVPLGVFLSGGLDSSAVVGMLAKKVDKPLKTFSVRYDFSEFGAEYDESVYAEQVSKQFNTEHKTITMTPEDFKRYIPEFVRTMDEPVTEAAALSLHFVSELAKEDVTVVLSGEGSDELFAGYDLYRYMQTIEKLRKIVTPVGASVAAALGRAVLPPGNKILKYLELASKPFSERYRGISVYDQVHRDGLYRDDYQNVLASPAASDTETFINDLFKKQEGHDLLSQMLYFDTKTWLVDDLLTKADRMSMGSSLELRVPFLDYRMVEFAASLPSKYKIEGAEGKSILKKLMLRDHLPENIVYREKKGFPTPLKMMFMGPLKDFCAETLLNKEAKINAYFNASYVERLCEEHWSGKADHHRILWQLIVIEEWLKQNT